MDKSYLHTKIAILGGSFASAAPSLGAEDFLVSGIMAVFGALVSFMVSLFLKYIFKRFKIGTKWFQCNRRKPK